MAAETPAQKVPPRAKWLILGLAILLGALVLTAALSLALHAWHLQQEDHRWCQFYRTVTAQQLQDHRLQLELEQLKVETGCQ